MQKQPSSAVLEKGVLKICSKFTGEHPCQRDLLKSHLSMGVLLSSIVIEVSESFFLFLRTEKKTETQQKHNKNRLLYSAVKAFVLFVVASVLPYLQPFLCYCEGFCFICSRFCAALIGFIYDRFCFIGSCFCAAVKALLFFAVFFLSLEKKHGSETSITIILQLKNNFLKRAPQA